MKIDTYIPYDDDGDGACPLHEKVHGEEVDDTTHCTIALESYILLFRYVSPKLQSPSEIQCAARNAWTHGVTRFGSKLGNDE